MKAKKLKIYFAAPLFSFAEKKFNLELTAKLEARGFEVFLPQRDGMELDPSYKRMKLPAQGRAIFRIDRDAVFSADILLFVLDGRVPDEGASVELGMAYAQKYLLKKKKVLVGLMTDRRAAFIGEKLNPMLGVPLEYTASSERDLIKFLSRL